MGKAEQDLTLRQRQVLALLRQGKANKEIAQALGIRTSTVKNHLTLIYALFGVTNRIEAALIWERLCQAAASMDGESVEKWPEGSVRAADLVPLEPALPHPTTPEQRFWDHVQRSPEPDGCWIWTGSSPDAGAGPRPLCYIDGLAHLGYSARRIAYMLVRGVSLPREVLAVPDCPHHNRRCVNPAHTKIRARGSTPEWRKWQATC